MTTLLAITAHPDDESFHMGGALARYAAEGHRCGLLCLTDGQAGRTGGLTQPGALGAVRREELLRATAVLGIEHVFTPGLRDGQLEAYGDEGGGELVSCFADDFGAEILLTFGPEGASGHADHRACWRWANAACNGRSLYAATFPEGFGELARGGPPLPITTTIDLGGFGERKRRAFLEHRTQQDHLELFDRVLELFDGKEYYHRVRPAWRGGTSDRSLI